MPVCRCVCSNRGLICACAALLNPPFEMGTWARIGFPHRLPASPPPTAVERILKRFGGLNPRSFLPFFSLFSTLLPFPHESRAVAGFKGLAECAGAAVPARPGGCQGPSVKSTVWRQRVGLVRVGLWRSGTHTEPAIEKKSLQVIKNPIRSCQDIEVCHANISLLIDLPRVCVCLFQCY